MYPPAQEGNNSLRTETVGPNRLLQKEKRFPALPAYVKTRRPNSATIITAFFIVLQIQWGLCSAACFIPSPFQQDTSQFHRHTAKLSNLQKAGDCMIAISKSRTSQNDDQDDIYRDFHLAGEALISAGNAWTVDWSDVTLAFEDASKSFYTIANNFSLREQQEQSELYNAIAEELQDASTIMGCLSIGPPSSVPNLQGVRDCFSKLAKLESDNDQFMDAADSITSLIEDMGT